MKKITFLVAMLVIGISSYAAKVDNNKSSKDALSVQCTYTQHESDGKGGCKEKQVTETTSRVGCALRKIGSAIQNIAEAVDDLI